MSDALRILVVDDEPDTLGLIKLTLQTAGYLVQTATGGREGLRLIREEPFDVVILDIMMPDVSGFDVMRELNNDPTPPPPVIFLTARSSEEDQETGMSLGVSHYLLKPITRGSLLDAINQALGMSPEPDASP
ncbi:MAG: response regulator [Anaerolineaceae bacterium]|nr:MAG: response regulator [Anaerolineaceae bacterium]